jgi:hypothetical protein
MTGAVVFGNPAEVQPRAEGQTSPMGHFYIEVASPGLRKLIFFRLTKKFAPPSPPPIVPQLRPPHPALAKSAKIFSDCSSCLPQSYFPHTGPSLFPAAAAPQMTFIDKIGPLAEIGANR